MHVRLIDGNSVGYAQHHANDVRRVGDAPVQAVEGFARHMRQWRQREPESLHVVLWDGRAQWRYDLAPEYKSGRHRTEEQRQNRRDYEAQRPWIQRVLRHMPVIQLTHPGMEADDLSFALSHWLSAQGHLVDLFTADQDWIQNVRNRVSWHNAKNRDQIINDSNFRKLTGCANARAFVEVKALMGDTSDDLEGAPGVKDVRAREIITEYGSLAEFWRASEDPFFKGPKYLIQAALPEVRERILRNLKLMDLSAAPAPDVSLAQLDIGEFVDIELYDAFDDYQFRSMCDAFDLFVRPLRTELTREQTSTFKRAVASMAKAYA
jgi:DNA polymerase I